MKECDRRVKGTVANSEGSSGLSMSPIAPLELYLHTKHEATTFSTVECEATQSSAFRAG